MRLVFSAFALLLLLLPAAGEPAATLVVNGDFARQGQAGKPPEGWSIFAHEGRFTVATDPTGGRGGTACLKVEGTAETAGGRAGVLQRSEAFAAPRRLEVRAFTRGTEGRRAVVIQFFDASNLKDIVAVESVPATGPDADWRELRAEVAVPRALKGKPIQVIVLLYLYGSGACTWDDVSLTPLNQVNLQVKDEESSPLLIRPYPADGAVVAQNPPDFRWRPEGDAVSYTLQLCRKPEFTGPSLITEERLPLNCHNLSRPLETGRWYWRIRFADEEGNVSGFGRTRSFEVPAGAAEFTLPPMAEIRKRLSGPHPRLYVTPETLPALRARRLTTGKEWWERVSPRVEQLLTTPPAAEPADCDLRGLPLDLAYFERDGRLRQASAQVSSGIWDLAFAYLITGERRYAEAAKRYLLHISRWNPEGATSLGSNDQVFRDIVIKSAMAYDWIAETLTAEEREAILKGIADRGRILFRAYSANDKILNSPYDSHGQTNIGYMGLVSLALAGDLPEAEEWAEYVIRVYCSSFPPWGDESGGWSQGVSYWKWSCSFAFQYIDALKTATGIDLYRKPWFRNNGLFKIYFHPPWCSMSHFGDTGAYGLDSTDRWNLARYAGIYGNSIYQWYANRVPAGMDTSPYAYLYPSAEIPDRAPLDLPQARQWSDIGWVAMHSRLYAPDDILLLAKSSPFGSFNHSHADQNGFVLYAFGEPLAIDSGYYPWYLSPHHKEWAIQTKAHNTVLVDGEGQPAQEITARGKSVAFVGGAAYAYWCGDATESYTGKLKGFRRHILHLRPDAFVVYDELQSAKPATFQWLLHALDKMEVDPAKQGVLVRRGKARLAVQHLLPAGLKQSQDGSFGVPPEARGGTAPNQWHYRAETATKAERQTFLTFLRAFEEPDTAGAKPALVRGTGCVGLRVGGELVAFAGGAAKEGVLGDLRFDGGVAAYREGTADSRYLLISGTRLQQGSKVLARCSSPCSVAAGWVLGLFEASVVCPADAEVRLRVGRRPASVALDGKGIAAGRWSYEDAAGTLRLRLAKGEHTLSATPAGVPQPKGPGPLALSVGTGVVKGDTGVARTANNTFAAWANLDAKPGIYRARVTGDTKGTRLWLDREALTDGAEIVLRGHHFLLAETASGARWPQVSIEDAYPGEGIPAVQLPDADPRLGSAVKIEAESYVEGLHGTPQIYSHRTFLSGGKGVNTPDVPGLGCRWSLRVARAGRYHLVLKSATHEAGAERIITLDGKPIADRGPTAHFANTGGYGGSPDQWKHHFLCNADGKPAVMVLSAGEHQLELRALSGALNLDYWLLVPVGE